MILLLARDLIITFDILHQDKQLRIPLLDSTEDLLSFLIVFHIVSN